MYLKNAFLLLRALVPLKLFSLYLNGGRLFAKNYDKECSFVSGYVAAGHVRIVVLSGIYGLIGFGDPRLFCIDNSEFSYDSCEQ